MENTGYKLKVDDRYDLGKASFGIKWFQEQLDKINSIGYLSEEVGHKLEEMFRDVGYYVVDDKLQSLGFYVGVHLTGHSFISEEFIQDVFNRGLINNGQKMLGGFSDLPPSIELTVTNITSMLELIQQLKGGFTYKNSRGAVLIKYPKDTDIDGIDLEYYDGINYRISPEYIYGFVYLERDYKVGEMIQNPNYGVKKDYRRK